MRAMGKRVVITVSVMCGGAFGDEATPRPSATPAVTGKLGFNRDIRPILSNYCYSCHGPDKGARKAEMRLDKRDEATRDLGGRHAIVPGDAVTSELVKRIFHEDPEERMPPKDAKRQPSDEQRRTLAAWVAQGAEYEPHWSYIPPRRAEAPQADGFDTPIDQFVAAALTTHGLEPSPQADPVTLVRRLSFDLTGLPPTLEQVERFHTDPSDAVYEGLVDEFLASPHYGERMAMHWLDQVRYADTNGYHSDETRSVSPYRDYVIQAFNANKPYDQFTREQLAGDLMLSATMEQKIASSFNRMNQLTAEGGAQSKEYQAKYLADRVRAVGNVWLGATLGCAECHDHKFDPYLTKEFYSLGAFFADLQEYSVYTTGESWQPLLYLPTDEEKKRTAELDELIASAKHMIETGDVSQGLGDWTASLNSDADAGWHPLWPTKLTSTDGSEFIVQDDYSVLVTGPKPESDAYTVSAITSLANITGVRLEILEDPSLNGGFSRAERGPVELSEFEVYAGEGESPQRVTLAKADQDRTFFGAKADSLIDGHLHGSWMILANKPNSDRVTAIFSFEAPLSAGPGTTLTFKIHQRGLNKRVELGRFRISVTTDATPALDKGTVGIPEEPLVISRKDGASRTTDEEQRLERYFRTIAPQFETQRADLLKAYDEKYTIRRGMLSTLVAKSVEPRVTRVLPRGNWMDESGEVVAPGVPAVLNPMHATGARATRMDLANWLMDPANPLTARVFVNRLWKLHFGRGISNVLDDLGAQGEWPHQNELLDWLAVEFRESGWDIKHMVKLLVSSRAYQRSSQTTERTLEADPGNVLFARQASVRLEAEMVRDNALSIAGMLSPAIGGRSVKPYQPEGYWRNANTFGGESLTYEPSKGADQYRRGMYTYWKRSFLHPSLLAFDAPTREECTAARPVSNTPSQALVLLNDPTYVEAARVLAERIVREGGATVDARIRFAVRAVLSRDPSEPELSILRRVYDASRTEYAADEAGAKALMSVGQWPAPTDIPPSELAPWSMVARTLMNLPETITRS